MVSETSPVSSLASLSRRLPWWTPSGAWGTGRGRLRRQQHRLRDRIRVGHAADALGGGENPLSLPAFTSETIVGAEGVFYADDVAVAIPTTRATPLIGYGTSGARRGLMCR